MANPKIPSVFDYPGALDDICDRIEAGETMAAIAKSKKVHRSQLTRWVQADVERQRRVDEARINSAEALAEMAMENIVGAKNSDQSTKARDLAHHLRWMAAVRDPRRYSNRTVVAGDRENPLVVAAADLTDEQLAAIAAGSGS
ncbi:hypothetical protein N5K27_22485 [Pigmentiphaga sp. GD03639]|uniref:terminase small subunit-like protein n=1 Tax=Pigmentiphaga sp. GD03639 TaxID=2975354 RepID=UPI0024492BCA|nr:hypothetical protein [Pigmentiphaga sp. GD03639]MDH2239080.1 hypothetical protein [Pigmentiphaga sp. GD03639]